MVQIQSKEEALEQGSDKKSSYQLAVEQPMDFMKLQDLLFNDDIQRAKLFPEGESNQVSQSRSIKKLPSFLAMTLFSPNISFKKLNSPTGDISPFRSALILSKRET